MTREEAIELLEDLYGAIEDNQGRDYDEAFRMAIEALSERTGEWKTDNVYAGIGFYRCDQCNFRQSEKSRYCPSCGADMRGKNNEA